MSSVMKLPKLQRVAKKDVALKKVLVPDAKPTETPENRVYVISVRDHPDRTVEASDPDVINIEDEAGD